MDDNNNNNFPYGNPDNGSQDNGFQDNSFLNNGSQDNGFQDNSFLNNGSQDNGFQDNGFQDNGFQNNDFQNNGFQNNDYQNNGFQNNGYQNNYGMNNYNMNQPPLDKKGRPMQNRFAMKLVFSILEMLSCNLISLVCGILGCVNTAKANKAYKEGRWDDFRSAAKSSAIALWVGLGGVILSIILSIVCLLLMQTLIFSYVNTNLAPTTPIDSWSDFIAFYSEYESQNNTTTPGVDEDYQDYYNDITGDDSTDGTTDDYDDGATLDEDYLNQQEDSVPGWENPDAAVLSDATFSMNGKSYTLPFDFSKLEKEGFYMDEDDNSYLLAANDYYLGTLYDKNDDYVCSLYFTNMTDEEAKMEDCSVTGISIENGYYTADVKFTLQDKITFSSTEKEVKKILGTPGDIYTPEDGSLDMLTWYGANYTDNFYDSLNISFVDDELSTISLMYMGK